MKKILGTLLLMLVTRLAANNTHQGRSMAELAKLKVTIAYLRAVKTSRYLFLSLLGMAICRGLFLCGFVLIHMALFVYSPWDQEVKMRLALGLGLFYFVCSGLICCLVFSERKWLHIFHAERLVEQLKNRNREQPQPATH